MIHNIHAIQQTIKGSPLHATIRIRPDRGVNALTGILDGAQVEIELRRPTTVARAARRVAGRRGARLRASASSRSCIAAIRTRSRSARGTEALRGGSSTLRPLSLEDEGDSRDHRSRPGPRNPPPPHQNRSRSSQPSAGRSPARGPGSRPLLRELNLLPRCHHRAHSVPSVLPSLGPAHREPVGHSSAPSRPSRAWRRGRPAQNEGGIFRREMPVSAPAGLGMKLQAKRANDFQDGGEIRTALAGERLVKAFARQPGILCDL